MLASIMLRSMGILDRQTLCDDISLFDPGRYPASRYETIRPDPAMSSDVIDVMVGIHRYTETDEPSPVVVLHKCFKNSSPQSNLPGYIFIFEKELDHLCDNIHQLLALTSQHRGAFYDLYLAREAYLQDKKITHVNTGPCTINFRDNTFTNIALNSFSYSFYSTISPAQFAELFPEGREGIVRANIDGEEQYSSLPRVIKFIHSLELAALQKSMGMKVTLESIDSSFQDWRIRGLGFHSFRQSGSLYNMLHDALKGKTLEKMSFNEFRSKLEKYARGNLQGIQRAPTLSREMRRIKEECSIS